MPFLIDSNVAIYLRDNDAEIMKSIDALGEFPALSIVSVVELEGGVYRKPQFTTYRRARLDEMLRELEVIGFGDAEAAAYRDIVAACGYSRADVLDRMIAATALVHGLTVITINGDDFKHIPQLALEIWPNPAA